MSGMQRAVLDVLDAEARAGRAQPLESSEVLDRVHPCPPGRPDGRRREWRAWHDAQVSMHNALTDLHDHGAVRPVGWVWARGWFWVRSSPRVPPCVICTDPDDPCMMSG